MKKILLPFLLIITMALCGCGLTDPKYPHIESKPSINSYTQEVFKKILDKEDFSLQVFDTNLYKNISVPSNENEIIKNFISCLANENYVTEGKPEQKHIFEIRILFKDGKKYIIKVYNKDFVTLFPWDGNYEEDMITMENVPLHYNLYDFCKHIINQDKKYRE